MRTFCRVTIGVLVLLSTVAKAQLFVDSGPDGAVYLRNAAGGSLGSAEFDGSNVALYVDGDITVAGTLDNQATEVMWAGNFTNNGTFTTTGDEVLRGENAQTLAGNFTGTNDFHNLILDKTAAPLVTLANNVEVAPSGTLRFVRGGIVETGTNYLLIKNTSANSLVGAGLNGSLNKFVLGELRRNVVAGSTYLLPVGGTYVDMGGGDGVQYASVRPTAGSGVISAIFLDGNGAGNEEDIIICPGGDKGEQTTEYRINNGAWSITNPGGGVTNFDLTLEPTDFTDLGYVDYTILGDGVATGRDLCDNEITLPPITHTGLTSFALFEVAASSNNVLVPIELLSFHARATQMNTVVLDWRTATETNNDFFTVERALDGRSWEPVSTIAGAGQSVVVQCYRATDADPYPGISYYRLKQTDFDGGYSHSRIRSVTVGLPTASTLRIYPNPSQDRLTIEGEPDELATLEIHDALGKEQTHRARVINAEKKKLVLDLSGLNAGVYFLKTKNGVHKLIKRR